MAKRSDLVLPCDTAPGFQTILVKIRNPKTRGRSAKHQSARIDPSDLVRLISAVYKDFDAEQVLWPYSPSTLRKRFAALMKVLELDVARSSDQAPFDLGSLRPGGATDLLFETEDSELVRRRGRWLSARVMEIYLQEVLSSTYVSQLPRRVQLRIEQLANVFPEVLEQAILFSVVSTFSGTEHIGAWDGGVSDVVVATHLEAVTTTEAHTWLEKEGGRNV